MPRCCSNFFLGFIMLQNQNWLNCVTLRVPVASWLQLNWERQNEDFVTWIWVHIRLCLWPCSPAFCFLRLLTLILSDYIIVFSPEAWREKRFFIVFFFPSQAPRVSQTQRKIAGEGSGSFFRGCCFSQWTLPFPFMCPFYFLLIPLLPYISGKQIAVWHEGIITRGAPG